MPDVKLLRDIMHALPNPRGRHARILAGECQLIGGISIEILRLRILEYAAHLSHIAFHRSQSGADSARHMDALQIAGIETRYQTIEQMCVRGFATAALST